MVKRSDIPFPERQSIAKAQLRRIIRNPPGERTLETQKYVVGTRVLGYSGKRSNVIRSVERQVASETSRTSRSVRSKDQAEAVHRAFIRRKRTTPGVYYDMILKRGQDISVSQYAIPQLYADGQPVMQQFIDRGRTIWDQKLPRILIQGGNRAAIFWGMALVDIADPETLTPEEFGSQFKLNPTKGTYGPINAQGKRTAISQKTLAAGTFGDLGDTELGVNPPPKDLALSIDAAVAMGLENIHVSKVCTRMVFHSDLAWDLYQSRDADQVGIWVKHRAPDTRIRGDSGRTVSWIRVAAP